MKESYLNRKCELLEFDLDFPVEGVKEEEDLKLMLSGEAKQPGKILSSSSFKTVDEGSEAAELSEGGEKELHSDSQTGEHSSLMIYFKAIHRFPLLKEEAERILARKIKESEKEFKDLVLKWDRLFKKNFLGELSSRQKKDINKNLQKVNGSFDIFNDLIKLEKERKKVNRALKKLDLRSNIKQKLEENLHKVETAIPKCIAQMNLSKPGINMIIGSLKEISNGHKSTKKQYIVKQELRRTLKKIGVISKKIKILKNQLVQANLRLVISIAKRYATRGSLTLPDLIQEGNLGLIDTYDYRRGYRFITYATWWIRQAIIRSLDCHSRTIRTPVYMNEKMNQITKASNRLLQEYKRKPTLEEIAEETNTSLERIEKVMQSFKDSTSLDAFIEEKGEGAPNLSTDNKSIPVLDQVISSHLSQITDVILSDLTQREREIIRLRFGIGKEHDHTLDEIGGEFNLSRERIRQILEVALNKLRNPNRTIQLKDFID